ncbi:MAG: hypothetical protein HYX24_02955 [Candidatus Aenigmarchaeota archaeon]|nr:hypothetical protein [Candidatus Aenigmarchaeota archaeon]
MASLLAYNGKDYVTPDPEKVADADQRFWSVSIGKIYLVEANHVLEDAEGVKHSIAIRNNYGGFQFYGAHFFKPVPDSDSTQATPSGISLI